jgi:hypothetical protein
MIDKELLEAAAPDLLRTIEQYEKHGVTCQTYRHFVSAPCAECNAAPQPAAKPLTDEQASEIVKSESWGPDAVAMNALILRVIRKTEKAHGISL